MHFIANLVTDPAKIIQFPITIFQMSLEFVNKILQLMV